MSPERRSYQPITIEAVAVQARETALEQNGHSPMLLAQGDKGMVVGGFDMPLPTFEMRQMAMYQAGRALANEGQVGILRQVFFISEAWMSLAAAPPEHGLNPAQDPERKEVLLIASLEMRHLQSNLVIYEMLRDEHDALLDLQRFVPPGPEREKIENPLLEAFAFGYLNSIGGRFN